MVRDRLAALKAYNGNSLSIEMAEIGQEASRHESTGMDEFMKQVEQILSNIESLSENVEEVKKIHSLILSTPQTEDTVKKKLETIMSEITRDANRIKTKLKHMEQETKDIGDDIPLSAEHRIRVTQYRMLFRRFKDVVDDYQVTQADHRDRCKARIKRQLEITGHIKTDDEIEGMIESGNPAIFNSEIIMETQQAKQSLAEIQARHNDIMKLEKSILELRDLFVDLATLVEEQGEIVNRIENHVALAKSHVDKGAVEVTQAIRYRSQARCKKILCFTILILIVAGILYSSFLL